MFEKNSFTKAVSFKKLRILAFILSLLSLSLLVLSLAANSIASIDLTLFGPKQYDRLKGKPTIYTDTFKGCTSSGKGILRVTNGNGDKTRITSAEISVNGTEVTDEDDFKLHSGSFEKVISLRKNNTLTVKLKSGRFDDDLNDRKNNHGSGREHDSDSKKISVKTGDKGESRKDRNGDRDNNDGDDNQEKRAPSFLIIEIIGQGCGISDTTPPLVSNSQPTDGSLINNAVPVISAQYADESGGSGIDTNTIRLTVDGKDVTSSASISLTGISYTPYSNLPEGTHTVTMSVSDLAHNPTNLTWRFTTDTIPPVVKITSPQNNQYLNTPVVIVSGTIDDQSAMITVNGRMAQISGNNFTLSGLALIEGSNSISVMASDQAGNVSIPVSVTVMLDTNAPATTASPASGLFNAGQSVALSATEAATIYYTTDGTTPTTASPVYNGPIPINITSTLKYFGVDLAGNSEIVNSAMYTIDALPPTLTLSTLADGSYTNNTTLNVAGTVQDNDGVQGVAVNGTAVTVNDDGSFSQAVTLSMGPNAITTIASDKAGNTTTDKRTVTLDLTAPIITILSPADNSTTNIGDLSIAGSVDKTATVTIKVNNGSPVSVDVAGNSFVLPAALTYGQNTIEVTATDLADNTSSAKRTVTFDNVSPALAVTNPPQDISTNQPDSVLMGTVADLTGTTVTINLDGTLYTPAVTNGTFQQQLTFTAQKSYAVIVAATDAAGNQTMVQRNIIYDITPPTIMINPVTTPTNQQNQTISGIMEANSTVSVISSTVAAGQVAYPTITTWQVALINMTEGDNTISIAAIDQAGNVSIPVSATITLDTTPPATTATPAGGMYGPGLLVTLATSETATIYYATDGSTPTTSSLVYTGPINVAATTTLQYFAVDSAGNSEAIKSAIYLVDVAPPAGSVAINGGAPYTNNPTVTLTLGCVAAISACAQMQLSNDNVTWSSPEIYISTKSWQLTPGDGQKIVYVKFTDGIGNVSQASSASITLNSASATTTLTINPLVPDGLNGWFKTIPSITLTSNVSGTTYYQWWTGGYDTSRLPQTWIDGGTPLNIRQDDGGGWYTLPFSFLFYGNSYAQVYLSSNGLISFDAEDDDTGNYAVGLINKLAIAPLWTDLRTDTRPNDDIYVFQPDADSIGFRWQAVTYDGEYDTNFEVILYRNGQIRFNYGKQDGNVFPTIGISSRDGMNYKVVYDGDISTTNNMESILFGLNDWKVYTTPINAAEGENTLYYYSSDRNSGQVEAIKSQLFMVDTITPVVTITSPTAGFINNYWPFFSYTVSEDTQDTVTLDGSQVNVSSSSYLGPLSLGKHTLHLESADTAGNIGTADVTFTVIDGPQTVTITSPQPGFITNNKPLLAYDVNYGSVKVKVDGIVVNKVSGDNLDVLSDGPHTVRIEPLDMVGNIRFAEVLFTVVTGSSIGTTPRAFAKLAAGNIHALAITADRNLWEWGATGTYGNGDPSVWPKTMGMDGSWSSVSSGMLSNLAVKSDGTLWAWGNNSYGQLGDGTTDDHLVPVRISDSTDWKLIATGGLHSLAVKKDGTLWSWGYNAYGQVGDGSNADKNSPVKIGTDIDWVAVSAGAYHSVALKSNGTIWTWGANYDGELGDGSPVKNSRNAPVQMGTDSDWIGISAGYNYTVAIKSYGTLWAWGANGYWYQGDWTTVSSPIPVQIGNDNNWTAISAGYAHTLALKANGTLWAWGNNSFGQLGDGTIYYNKHNPVQIGTATGWSSIAAGDTFSMAMKSDGTLWTWGDNWYGQLGDGSYQSELTPHWMNNGGISINAGANFTNNANVQLNVNVRSRLGLSIAMMQFSSDGSNWMPPVVFLTDPA